MLLIDAVRGYNCSKLDVLDIDWEKDGTQGRAEPWGTQQDEGNMEEEVEPEVTKINLLGR